MKLGVLRCLRKFFSSPQLLTLYIVLFACMGGFTHTALLDRLELKPFRVINSSLLTDCLQPLSFRWNVASLAIFGHYFHVDYSIDLASYMPPVILRSRCTRPSSSLLFFFHFSNVKVNQYSHYSFLSLVNFGNSCLPLYFQLRMIWLYLRERFQDICL